MDKLIKYVITDKLSNIKIDKSIHIEEYYKMYHYFIYQYIKGYLHDNTMYMLTYLLIGKYKVIELQKIYDFKHIMSYHINYIKRTKTFTLLNIYHNLYKINNKIQKTISFIKNNSTNMYNIFNNHKKTKTLKKLIKYHFIDYLLYYEDRIMQLNIMFANSQKEATWMHELEISNRLEIIARYYGVNLLQIIGVDIIDNKYYDMMTFDEKVLYYKKCVNIISSTGKYIYSLLESKKKIKKLRNGAKEDYKQYKEIEKDIEKDIVCSKELK